MPSPTTTAPTETTDRVEVRGAGDHGFPFGPADNESESIPTRPVSATIRKHWRLAPPWWISRMHAHVVRIGGA